MTNDYTDNVGNPLRGRASLFYRQIARVMGLGEQRVYYGLVMAFGLLFVLPSLGFFNFAFKYDFFADRDITCYFLSILIFFYLGFFLLRSHADRIRNISENIAKSLPEVRQDSKKRRQASQIGLYSPFII